MEKRQGSKLFFTFLLCFAALLLMLFWTYISAIVLALLITSVLYPMYFRIRRAFREKDGVASVFMIVFVFLVIIVPLSWFVATLSNEAFDFYKRTSNTVSMTHLRQAFEKNSVWTRRIRKAVEMAGGQFTPQTVEKVGASVGKNIGLFLYKQLSSVASNLLNFLVHFFLMMLVIFYLFRDGVRLKDYLIQLLPMPEEQLEKVAKKFHEMGRAIIVGNGLAGIVQGILGGLGFYLFGLHSPFLWGTVIAFMAFLPVIGASIVFIPAAAIFLIQGKIGAGLLFLAYNICYSSVMEYLVKPRLIGQGMQMNSLLVFIGIVGGMKLFGILGIIYGPLIITIFLTLAEIYRIEYKERVV
ncbi:MAG: hypothetical protein DRH56_01985 [Deltaproteobacteria bacterium]|nr:MAG: hypothetical protein DRH56_01985 [Deltaproteobacteria bacterium]